MWKLCKPAFMMTGSTQMYSLLCVCSITAFLASVSRVQWFPEPNWTLRRPGRCSAPLRRWGGSWSLWSAQATDALKCSAGLSQWSRQRSRRTLTSICEDIETHWSWDLLLPHAGYHSFTENGLLVLSIFFSFLLHLRATSGGDWPVQESATCFTELWNQRVTVICWYFVLPTIERAPLPSFAVSVVLHGACMHLCHSCFYAQRVVYVVTGA